MIQYEKCSKCAENSECMVVDKVVCPHCFDTVSEEHGNVQISDVKVHFEGVDISCKFFDRFNWDCFEFFDSVNIEEANNIEQFRDVGTSVLFVSLDQGIVNLAERKNKTTLEDWHQSLKR